MARKCVWLVGPADTCKPCGKHATVGSFCEYHAERKEARDHGRVCALLAEPHALNPFPKDSDEWIGWEEASDD